MALADSYTTTWPTIGDAQQRLEAVVQAVGSMTSLAQMPGAAGATGCPEAGAAVGEVASAVGGLLTRLATALAADNATLATNVSNYHLAETTVQSSMQSTAGSVGAP